MKPSYVAIVLAGARSERLGGVDKAMIEVEGQTLLDRVLGAVEDADHIVVVGPERPTSAAVTWCEEDPTGGGPAAAFASGLAAPANERVLLLACDLPFIGEGVAALLTALTPSTEAAVLVDTEGRANYLASVWRRAAVEAQLAKVGDPTGLPIRRVFEGLTVTEVGDTGGWGFDCDTWEALDRARQRGATPTP